MKRSSLAVLALALSLVPACSKKPAEPDVKIGLLAELTGDFPAVGASCRRAAEMAVEEINLEGIKIGGQKHGIKLVIADSGSKADQAAAAAKKLVDEDKVLAIVGPNLSRDAIPVAAVAEAGQTVIITPWSTDPKTTMDGANPRKWVFRACFNDTFQAHLLARMGQSYMHATKAAVLYASDSEAPKTQAELFKKSFEEAGGKVVAFETFKTGDKDFKAQLEKIKAAGPEVIFAPSYYNEVPLQLKQAHEVGLTVPFLGSDNWGTTEFLKLAGSDAEGTVFSTHYNPKAKNPITGTFVISYGKRYGGAVPDDVAALTYDAFSLLKQALVAAGKLERPALRDALTKASLEGVTGKIAYKAGAGDPTKGAVIQKVMNGEFTFVTNIDP